MLLLSILQLLVGNEGIGGGVGVKGVGGRKVAVAPVYTVKHDEIYRDEDTNTRSLPKPRAQWKAGWS